MDRNALRVVVEERKVVWQAPLEVARAALGVLTSTSFGPADGMSLDDGEWVDVDLDAAIARFRSPSAAASLRGASRRWEGHLTRTKLRNVAMFGLEPPYSLEDRAPVLSVLEGLAAALPEPRSARVTVGPSRSRFHAERQLPVLPVEFGQMLAWAHLLPPTVPIDREALLGAPAHRVEERAGGAILLQVHEDPERHSEPDVLDRVERLTRYLLDHRTPAR